MQTTNRAGAMSHHHSHRFSHAICRTPARSIVDGLRAGKGPDPDADIFARQFDAYVAALEQAGLHVTRLPPLEAFPDSVFVEDPALCLPEGAIILRPGAASRIGEAAELERVLEPGFERLAILCGPGFVDGGDIMVTGSEVIVGLSARTDAAGFAELADILHRWGLAARCVDTPRGVLHLKTASAILGTRTVLCTPAMARSGIFEGYTLIETAPGEEAAANAIRVNDTVFVSAGFEETAARIADALRDVDVVALDTSQAARVDGGLSCMSLRFFQSA